ncbi:YtxH domain-containing protein [Neobacillus muris]|uniref:YtxH domain-containing protein n=1 Tax=Neobacillus muris TaxID=2941334 RepID=UPI0020414127|nr:YtxH domain-containing protein [Neobacillus muris]
MTRKNQFWKGMFLGAIAGGAVSLLDQHTRKVMTQKVKKVSGKISYMVRNPGEVTDSIKGTAQKVKAAVEHVSEDIAYIVEKVDELRELTPKVTESVKEVKDTFTKLGDDDLELQQDRDYH